MKSSPRYQSAFTLLEIMLVVMIIALLAGGAVYMMGDNLGVARDVRVETDIQGISTRLMTYQITTGSYPTTEQGLKALVTRPDGAKQWRKLADEVPVDPWKNEYQYVYPGKRNPEKFDIFSKGPDGKADTADDVGNWKK